MIHHRSLTCRELVELVTDYFDDALPRVDRSAFERHVSWCRGCRAYVEQMQMTLRLLAVAAQLEPTPELTRVMQAFRSRRKAL